MHHMLHDIQNMCDNKWFVTHLTDLLFHCDKLQITGEQQTKYCVQFVYCFVHF